MILIYSTTYKIYGTYMHLCQKEPLEPVLEVKAVVETWLGYWPRRWTSGPASSDVPRRPSPDRVS